MPDKTKSKSKRRSTPRNPLARHPLLGKGGVHEKPAKARRQSSRQALLKDLEKELPES